MASTTAAPSNKAVAAPGVLQQQLGGQQGRRSGHDSGAPARSAQQQQQQRQPAHEQHESDDSSAAPLTSSFDEPGIESNARLGYKDELDLRFIWDRVLGRGRHGTTVRAVVDRYTGQEYACKCMPKAAPEDTLSPSCSPQETLRANEQQLQHIKREVMLFTKLRSSLNVAKLEQVCHACRLCTTCLGKLSARICAAHW